MVNFHDPGVIEKDFSVAVKLWHTLDGVFLWEFVTTLDYEWKVIQGRITYRWTIWVYSLTRVATLVYVILVIIRLDTTKLYHCQVAATIKFILGYVAFVAASLLIVLRVIAIWNRKKVIMVTAFGLWLANLALLIQGPLRMGTRPILLRRDYVQSTKPNIFATITTDILLLLIMLLGLFRMGCDGVGMSGLARFLWKQGVFWLLIAIVAEVPPVVLIILDMNDSLNFMFQPPSVIIMSIAATRMYRSLAGFVYGFTEAQSGSFQNRSLQVSKTKRISAPRTSLSQMQVAVHIPCQDYSESQTTAHYSCVDLDGERPDQPNKQIVDDHDRESDIYESAIV
ncbi:hypothetical protein BC827DRAFT_539492 [Russula dissimulans]|nr:hypothetical protein BC827DRAFT_539492 [Russula dissimulans]